MQDVPAGILHAPKVKWGELPTKALHLFRDSAKNMEGKKGEPWKNPSRQTSQEPVNSAMARRATTVRNPQGSSVVSDPLKIAYNYAQDCFMELYKFEYEYEK